MRRRGDEQGRPPIPDWVADFRCYDGSAGLSYADRYRQWGREQWEWIEAHGYNVFDLNDRAVEMRRLAP